MPSIEPSVKLLDVLIVRPSGALLNLRPCSGAKCQVARYFTYLNLGGLVHACVDGEFKPFPAH